MRCVTRAPRVTHSQNMPMEYLWSEDAIREGDTSIIVPLLLQVRKAYGHHLKAAGRRGDWNG